MSSKTEGETFPWSLAARLTLWYAGAGFLLVAIVSGYLYWALARNLVREDDEWLSAKTSETLALAEARPGDIDALRRQVAPGAFRVAEPMFLRIRTSQAAVETSGMDVLLPERSFPPPGMVQDLMTAD